MFPAFHNNSDNDDNRGVNNHSNRRNDHRNDRRNNNDAAAYANRNATLQALFEDRRINNDAAGYANRNAALQALWERSLTEVITLIRLQLASLGMYIVVTIFILNNIDN